MYIFVTPMSKIQSQLLHTGFHGMRAEWSNSGELLAVAGRVNIIIDGITLGEYDDEGKRGK